MSKKFKKPKPLGTGTGPRIITGPGALPSMEKFHRTLAALMRDKKFGSVEETNDYLQTLLKSGELQRLIDEEPDSPREKALDLAVRAMEEPNSRKARSFAQKALALDPDCVDALVLLAQMDRLNEGGYIDRLRSAVAAGERSLGESYFAEYKGHFWGHVESRPYMRARFELALTLHGAGKFEEACVEFEALLELNPQDNQGARYYLLGLYLAQDLHAADRLLESYPDDSSPAFLWGRVFRALIAGDRTRAKEQMPEAFESNPFVLETLLGFRKARFQGPEYEMGSEEEADYTVEILVPAFAGRGELIIECLFLMKDRLPPKERAQLEEAERTFKLRRSRGAVN